MSVKLKVVKNTLYTQCPRCKTLFIVPFDRRHIFGERVICSADGCNEHFIAEKTDIQKGKRGSKRSLYLWSEYARDCVRMDYPAGILPEDFFRIIQSPAVVDEIVIAIRDSGINISSARIDNETTVELINAIAKNPIAEYPSYENMVESRRAYEDREKKAK